MMKAIIALFMLLCLAAGVCSAVPQQINYQGFLTRANGTALDTAVAMTFRLYSDSLAGPLIWMETRPAVAVQSGLFGVRLGELTALSDAVLNTSQVWLGITVGGDAEMTPRVRVVSVGYSYRVETVDGASGGTISDKVNIGTGNANSGTFANVLGANCAASGNYSSVGGGFMNQAADSCTVVTGGSNNRALGLFSTVVGGAFNTARGTGAVVVGGGSSAPDSNGASGGNSAVVAGGRNFATGSNCCVAGGFGNTASGRCGIVLGGEYCTASGDHSVAAGISGSAIGAAACVPGGLMNLAQGNYSFAAGRQAKARHSGSFVWSDYDSLNQTDFADSIANEFRIRADGGVYFFTSNSYTIGAKLPHQASAWVALSDSNRKTDIRIVDTKTVLEKIASLPIKEWRYKAQSDPSIHHVGPMAQDFWKAFHLGEDSLGISTIDPDGIALAAIQELQKENEALKAQNKDTERRLSKLEAAMAASASVNVAEKGK